VIRLPVLALLAFLADGPPDGDPQALMVTPAAVADLRALWTASVGAGVERVACLASTVDHDTLRITRILALSAGADSTAVSAQASLDTCGPPDWQGTVHTHIAQIGGAPGYRYFSGADRGIMLMWWRRWKADGTFCLLYAENEVHCEIDGSRLVILPSGRY
jgi:hypothetical protein